MTNQEILKEEKEKALGMVKVANYQGVVQDPYPSPFLNLSDTQIPKTANEIFKWCKYFYMFDPLIAGAVNSLSSFPVTSVHLEDYQAKDEENEDDSNVLKDYERVLFKSLNIHKLLIEIGIDYHLFGNCFIFGEMHKNKYSGESEWKSMVRLDPSKMVIDYNAATQGRTYRWEVPANIVQIVTTKQPKEEFDKIPDIIKKAVKEKKTVILKKDNVYHFSRATDSMGDNNVWGTPVIANVLKLLMYRNVLRQAQEAIAREHIVPMRVYYLQRTEDYAPETDWNNVAKNFAGELMKSTRDPNYKVVSPVPVNMINVGGQGRALLLTPEIQQIQEEVLAGMGVPREFIFGGVSFSSSSISLKILENQFITYRLLLMDFLQNFVIKRMAQARKEWVNEADENKMVSAKMTELKMQDDVQQKSLVVQLNGAGKISDDYMWQILEIDGEKMRKNLQKELMGAAERESQLNLERLKLQKKELESQFEIQKRQVEIQTELRFYQTLVERKMADKYGVMPPQGPPGTDQGEGGGGAPKGQAAGPMVVPDAPPVVGGTREEAAPKQQKELLADEGSQEPTLDAGADPEVTHVAKQLLKLPASYRQTPISKFPEHVQQKINAEMNRLEMLEGSQSQTAVDMRPMPEKLPPRRKSLS